MALLGFLLQEKIQTNDDVLEIEVQTDEIENITRWTQYPPEDSKGYGTGLKNIQRFFCLFNYFKKLTYF